jgi:prevent-host-death family protein
VDEVTIRELRNRGGDVLDRVSRGEILTVTRDGHPIAELRPLMRPPVTVAVLLDRWRPVTPPIFQGSTSSKSFRCLSAERASQALSRRDSNPT